MKKLDLLQYQEQFLQYLGNQGKSFNTLKNYRTDLNIFNQFLQGKKRELIINEVTISEIQDYGQFLENKYNSPNSIRRRVQALRIFFDYLIQISLFDTNPVKKMLVSPKVVDLPNPTSFALVQSLHNYYHSKIENSDGHEELLSYRNLIIFYLIYGAGLKVSDIERLQLSHLMEKDGIYRVLIAPDKRDPYTVQLPELCSNTLRDYLVIVEKRKNIDDVTFTNLLFNANPFKILKGGLSARGIEVIFKEISKVLKSPITAKSLRQSCIFKWLTLNIQDSSIKEWMGVQPQYSLKPYKNLLQDKPEDYSFMEI